MEIIEREDESVASFNDFIVNALIVCEFARIDGKHKHGSRLETLFLAKWLKDKFKKRQYPRLINDDLKSLIGSYDQNGPSISLGEKLRGILNEYRALRVRYITYNEPAEKRFENCIEKIRKLGWSVSLPLEHDPRKSGRYIPKYEKEVFTLCYEFFDVFQQGEIIKPINLFIHSDPKEIIDTFYSMGFVLFLFNEGSYDGKQNANYQIHPNNICGLGLDIKVPSKYN